VISIVAGKAYGMNVITPMRPYLTWINRFVFMLSRAPELSAGPPWPVDYPFARWAIIKRNQWPNLGQGNQALQNDYVLFCSNFNGRWDQYIPDPLVGNHSAGTKTCPKAKFVIPSDPKTERYPA
jgi:hypothetical protein